MGKNYQGNKIQNIISKNSGLEKICLHIIEWGTYLALLTPLVVSKYFFFPYVVPKTVFFRIVVGIIAIAYILLLTVNSKYKPKMTALTISITVFMGVLLLTSLTGVNFLKSLFSTFERMTGFLTLLHLYFFYIILSSVFREKKYWDRFLTVSICAGIYLVFYVFYSNDPTARGGGTLGNTSFMSTYLIFNIFFSLILFLTKKGGWKAFYGLSLIPLSWLLFFPPKEPSRGAIIAFSIGLGILIISYLWFLSKSTQNKNLKRIIVAIIVVGMLGGIASTQLNIFKEKFSELQNSSSWHSREVIWHIGWDSFKDRFLFGWGLENFNIPFATHYRPAMPLTNDIWYDRVHNIILDTAVTSGIIGLLSFLAILGTIIFKLIKISFSVQEKKNAFIPLGMMALIIAYIIQGLFVFDMISSYMIFFFTLAFINFLFVSQQQISQSIQEKKLSCLNPFIGVGLIIITVFTIYFGNIQPARASYYIVKAISAPAERAIGLYQKAINTSAMSIFEGPEQFARKFSDLAYSAKQDKTVLKNGFELAIQAMEKSIEQSNSDFRYHLFLGKIYNDFYQIESTYKNIFLAEQEIKKAEALSPLNQQVYWTLAQTRLYEGRLDESVALMQKAVDLEPRYGLAHWYLAMTYYAVGGQSQALEEIDKSYKNGYDWKERLDNVQKVIDICQKLENDARLVEAYLLAAQLEPTNAQYWVGLAVSNANLGQFNEARASAAEAIRLKPEYAVELQSMLDSFPK